MTALICVGIPSERINHSPGQSESFVVAVVGLLSVCEAGVPLRRRECLMVGFGISERSLVHFPRFTRRARPSDCPRENRYTRR